MRKSILSSFAAAAAVAVAISGQARAADNDPIVFGMPVALSGYQAAYDLDSVRMAQMVIEDINASGGLLGHQIKVEISDDKSDPVQSAKSAQELIDKGAKLFMVSCDYDIGGPAAQVAQEHGLIAISPCGGSAKLGPQGIGPNVFTMASAALSHGFIMAEWGFKKKGYKTAYLLKDTFVNYTRLVADGFAYRWKELAGKEGLLGVDTFKNDDPSIASQITKIKNLPKKPDVIFVGSINPGTASALRQIRNAGIDTPLMAHLDLDGDYWVKSVPGISNLYFGTVGSIFGDDPRPEINTLFKKYETKFGSRPATALGLYGMAVVEAFQKAITRANSFDTPKVLAELEKFKDEPTAAGPHTFTKDLHIQTKAQYLMFEVKDGKVQSQNYFFGGEEPVPMDILQ